MSTERRPPSGSSTELTAPVALCDPDGSGRLDSAAVGWSRRPLHRCDLKGAWGRKKRWNYWAFTTPTHLFSVTVSNLDYAGLAFVYVADFQAGTVCEETVLVPLARGCELPDTVGEDVRFERGGLVISMLHDPSDVRVRVEMERFAGRGLEADLRVSYPAGHETLNVVVPWSERRFQFTAKHNTLPARGSVRLGAGRAVESERISFEGPDSFGCLDFGRGVWPRRCVWNWGAASGVEGGRVVGLNLGGQWTDGTGATENAVCVDGRLAKVDADLVWEYERAEWMKPWRIFDAERRAVDLEFTPMLERVAATRALIVRSEVHQMFGHYRGRVADADGRFVELDGLLGWAEDHQAVW